MRRGARGLTLEKDLRAAIVQAALYSGWKCYFTWHSIHSPAGYPDLCLVKGDRLIFAELKNEKNKLTDDQESWLEALRGVPGVAVYIWRPQDLDDALEVLQAA